MTVNCLTTKFMKGWLSFSKTFIFFSALLGPCFLQKPKTTSFPTTTSNHQHEVFRLSAAETAAYQLNHMRTEASKKPEDFDGTRIAGWKTAVATLISINIAPKTSQSWQLLMLVYLKNLHFFFINNPLMTGCFYLDFFRPYLGGF